MPASEELTVETALSAQSVLMAAENGMAEFIPAVFEYKPGRCGICSWPGAGPCEDDASFETWKARAGDLPKWVSDCRSFSVFQEMCQILSVFFLFLEKNDALDEFMGLYNSKRRAMNLPAKSTKDYIKLKTVLIF